MQNEQYEIIRRKVVTRLVVRASFVFNILFFLLVSTILLRDVVFAGKDTTGLAFFLLVWSAGLILHGAVAFNFFGRFIDHAVQKELEREQLKQKPKHQRVELGDDGELIEVAEDALSTHTLLNDAHRVNHVRSNHKS